MSDRVDMVEFEPTTGSNNMMMPGAAPHSDHIGQSTSIEQTRAVAEVEALVIVAQRRPRDVSAAMQEMQQSCQIKTLADRAFYKYPRGDENITGPTVVLAKELARCWRNVQYSVTELRQDRGRHESEMLAWAWDMQANMRVERRVIVPHVRDTKKGPKVLTDVRDVYEILANNAARRLRECILDILPPWFVEQAKTLCWRTMEDGGGEPIEVRRVKALNLFEELAVTRGQLEQKVGRRVDGWSAHDLAMLRVTYTSIKQGSVTIEDEFPPEPLTGADVVAAQVDPALAAMAAPVAVGEALAAAADNPQVPPDYVCDICQATGEHFQDACPPASRPAEQNGDKS
jgi:hypothetical protein